MDTEKQSDKQDYRMSRNLYFRLGILRAALECIAERTEEVKTILYCRRILKEDSDGTTSED
jgi:hypothetical protein